MKAVITMKALDAGGAVLGRRVRGLSMSAQTEGGLLVYLRGAEMLHKEDPYLAFDVPGQGKAYFDEVSAGMTYWTNISAEGAEEIRSNGMVYVNRFTGDRTSCLAIQEFGRKDGNPGTEIFAKWRARLFDGTLIDSELEAAGGVLDRLDYGRVRRLGVRLRNVSKPSADWDLPPSSLQGWVDSFRASTDSLEVASASGLLRLLQTHADEIRAVLSQEMLPAVDRDITDARTLDDLIALAKEHDRLKGLDLQRWQCRLPSETELARALVVQLGVTVPWPERPKVDEETGLRRLKLGALISQVALGGAVAVGNMALGAVGGVVTSVAGMTGSAIPLVVGLLGSTYAGFNGLLSAVDKLVDALKK